MERPLQLIYPLELQCDQETSGKETLPLNPQADEFRPKRKAAKEAQVSNTKNSEHCILLRTVNILTDFVIVSSSQFP